MRKFAIPKMHVESFYESLGDLKLNLSGDKSKNTFLVALATSTGRESRHQVVQMSIANAQDVGDDLGPNSQLALCA